MTQHSNNGDHTMVAMAASSHLKSAPSAPPVHDAHHLTQGGGLAQILLDGKVYQLRITRAGKLILTK
jgi:hemin uptake protein HemP